MRFGSLTPVAAVVEQEPVVFNCCFCCAMDCKVRPNMPSNKNNPFRLHKSCYTRQTIAYLSTDGLKKAQC